MSKFLPLIRVGKFKDRHGTNYDITDSVLDNVAKKFDPNRPPQLTVGHPDRDKVPSFGIVAALKKVGDTLFFKPAKFAAEFAALVREGKFPGVSAGLSKTLDRLDHVALLSAQNPAVPGLAPIAEFSAPPEGESVELDVTESANNLAEFGAPAWWVGSRFERVAELLRGVKNYMIEKEGAATADRLLPEYCFEMLNDEPPQENLEDLPTIEDEKSDAQFAQGDVENGEDDFEFSDNKKDPAYVSFLEKSCAEFSQKLEAANKTIAAHVDKIAALENSQRSAEFCAWVEDRIAEGRVLPNEKDEIVGNLEKLFTLGGAEFSSDPVNFPNAVDIYQSDIMKRPVRDLTTQTPPPEFSASDLSAVEIAGKAQAYQAQQAALGINVPVWDAVRHVRGEK